MYKLAGALARRGAPLDEVYSKAQWLSTRMGTIGAGLEHCHVSKLSSISSLALVYFMRSIQVPGTEAAKSHLAGNEIEIGMGIHNEPGHTRLSPVPERSKIIEQMLGLILSTTDKERSFLPLKNDGSDEVVLMVNNLGGLSELELAGIAGDAVQNLEGKVKIHRVMIGTFMVRLCPCIYKYGLELISTHDRQA